MSRFELLPVCTLMQVSHWLCKTCGCVQVWKTMFSLEDVPIAWFEPYYSVIPRAGAFEIGKKLSRKLILPKMACKNEYVELLVAACCCFQSCRYFLDDSFDMG